MSKESKCFSCKHGLCVRETLEEIIITPSKDKNKEESWSPYPEEQEDEIIERHVTHIQTKVLCFWKPPSVDESPPIVMSHITRCNRYEPDH